MNIKSFLIAGAAVLAAGTAVQAADLGAEPVDYVKVCDAFGSGYYYAPGTDTCIRINGYVRFNAIINRAAPGYGTSNHYFETRGQLNVHARSMTEYGPLVGWIQLEGNVGSRTGAPPAGSGFANILGVTAAILSLGPLTAGYDYSFWARRPIIDTFDSGEGDGFNGRDRTQFVALNWAVADGIGLALAAEDYRGRDGSANISTGQLPDLIANLMITSGPLQFQAGFGYGDRITATSWGANAAVRVNLDSLAKGDALVVGAVYAAGDDGWIDGQGNVGGVGYTAYSIYGSFLHFFSSQFGAAVSGEWRSDSGASLIAGQVRFIPVKNFTVTGEVQFLGTDFATTDTRGLFRLQRHFP
jgi:hypothetical protein